MLVLGIETATPTLALALWQDGEVLAEEKFKLKNRHAEVIAGSIEHVLKTSRVEFEALGGLAVSLGPGSFTGLRIGMACAKGVAFSHRLPLVGIHTPDAIAAGIAPLAERMVVVLPSRKGEVYAAPYRNLDGAFQREGKIAAVAIRDFANWAGMIDTVAGPGVVGLREAGLEKFCYLSEMHWQISAAAIARLGARRILTGDTDDLAALEPEYFKPFYTTARPVQWREA